LPSLFEKIKKSNPGAGMGFELKYDSLTRLDFKGVACMVITDPPVAKLTFMIVISLFVNISWPHFKIYNKLHTLKLSNS
jgi:hypothetical protein